MKPADDRNLGIDVLRGAAAVAVLVYHAREMLWVGLSKALAGPVDWAHPDTLLGVASLPFRWGGLGVPLFFVISGYCIHRPHARKRAKDPGYGLPLGNYALRRLWRIYPVLVAALVLTAACDAATRSYSPADANLGDDSAYSFVMNLLTMQNVVTPAYGSNSPLWTLAVETHFYLVYPLVFWAIGRAGPLATLLGVLAVNAAYLAGVTLLGGPDDVFLSYWFAWTVGAYLADAELGRAGFPVRALAVPAAVGLAAVMAADRTWAPRVAPPLAVPLGLAASAPAFALLVWWAVARPRAWVWTNALARVLARVGVFSFSLYATHKPVLVLYRAVVLGGDQSASFSAVLPALAVAVGVAYLTFLLVEQWSLRLPGSGRPLSPGAIAPADASALAPAPVAPGS